MATIKKTSTKTTVRATANGGREYEVEFDPAGEIISVATRFRRGCDYRTQSRTIYTRRQRKPMSLTAACAGRAAVEVLVKRAAKASASAPDIAKFCGAVIDENGKIALVGGDQ